MRTPQKAYRYKGELIEPGHWHGMPGQWVWRSVYMHDDAGQPIYRFASQCRTFYTLAAAKEMIRITGYPADLAHHRATVVARRET